MKEEKVNNVIDEIIDQIKVLNPSNSELIILCKVIICMLLKDIDQSIEEDKRESMKIYLFAEIFGSHNFLFLNKEENNEIN